MNVHANLKKAIRRLVEAVSLDSSAFRVRGPIAEEVVQTVLAQDGNEELTEADVYSLIDNVFAYHHYDSRIDHTPAQIDHVSGLIVEALETLPRSYTLAISLPSIAATRDFRYELSETVQVFVSEEVTTPRTWFSLPMDKGLTFRMAYLSVRFQGYYARGMQGGALDGAWARVRECAYLLTAGRGSDAHGTELHYSGQESTAHVSNQDGQKFLEHMPPGLSSLLGQIQIPGGDGLGFDDAEGQRRFINALSRAKEFYSLPATDDRRRIAAAMEWLIDSEISSDQTMGYLAACIGLESLLGEGDSELQTTRLEDRYAYLLGGAREVRKKLAKDLREVFRIRGHLVHARASRLRGRDLNHLRKAQAMLTDCLWHELNTLLATSRPIAA